LFGLAPVVRAVRVDLNASLKAGGRGGQSEGGLYLRRHRVRGLLVVSELALSLMLLIAAGLLIRSFVRLQSVPPGFTTDRLLTMQVVASDPKYRDGKAAANLFQQIDARVAHLSGVLAEGTVSALPLTGSVGWGGINVQGYTPPPGQELQVDMRIASSDYFRAMEIPLRKGRFFTEHDTPNSMDVVIIDEKFAQRFWPDGDPIGKHVWLDPKKPMTIRRSRRNRQAVWVGCGYEDRHLFSGTASARPGIVPRGAHFLFGSRQLVGHHCARNPQYRSKRGRIRNPHYAGPPLRLAGA
jgi:hypothetical protein